MKEPSNAPDNDLAAERVAVSNPQTFAERNAESAGNPVIESERYAHWAARMVHRRRPRAEREALELA